MVDKARLSQWSNGGRTVSPSLRLTIGQGSSEMRLDEVFSVNADSPQAGRWLVKNHSLQGIFSSTRPEHTPIAIGA
jgi:hypothetical protein